MSNRISVIETNGNVGVINVGRTFNFLITRELEVQAVQARELGLHLDSHSDR